MLTILHVSDVHFGASDLKGEQSRISEALVEAARAHAWVPDICVFSGDLAFKGDEGEFRWGLEWLSKLTDAPWETKIFIVPGNHDILRKRAPASLRLAVRDATAFDTHRGDFERELPHLDGFRQWHSEARAALGSRLLSDWSTPFGCHNTLQINGHLIHFVGLNTSLLSFHDDDIGNLAQDIPTLNRLLANRKDCHECVIAIGHHPLSWLAPWNEREVSTLLGQESGANLYLHGHLHEQALSVFGSGTGQNLAVLGAGAAYQGSDWPQLFAFYQLDFDRREINSQIFLYSPNAGEWILDLSRSIKMVAPIPLARGMSTSEPSSAIELSTQSKAPSIRPPTTDVDITELYAWRAIAYANQAQALVHNYLTGDQFLESIQYSRGSRIKSIVRIKEKIKERLNKGDMSYGVNDLTDICGFRIVTLFQAGIPLILDRLLRAIPSAGTLARSPFRTGDGVSVTVHTSRPASDPLS
jgi:3',5'-cyclic AMP phosphodiesterase CpdA